MKRIGNIVLVVLLSTFSYHLVQAQKWEDKKDEVHEKVKAEKVAYLTSKLDLTPEEAQKFWPIYNQYDKERLEIHDIYKQRPKSYIEITDADAEKYLERLVKIKEKEYDLEKKYIPKFKSVLPVKKVAGLYHFEKEFRKEVFGRLKERMNRREKSGESRD